MLQAHRRRRRALIAALCSVAILLIAPLAFGVALWTRLGRVDAAPTGSAPGGTTYLLVGSDTRAGIRNAIDRKHFGNARQAPGADADLVLLLRVSDQGRPQLLSVPRDLLVFSKKHSLVRLGPTLNGGAQPVIDELCRSLGIGVDHVAIIGFLDLQRIVDTVGGIDITTKLPTRDTVLHTLYTQGRHHLDGQAALSFVRARHFQVLRGGQWIVDPAAGVERGTRARLVLEEIARRAPSLGDPLGFARFAWVTAGSVTVDGAMGIGDVRSLSSALHALSGTAITELPVTIQDGPVPVAQLDRGAVTTLERFTHVTAKSPCSRPHIPYSDGTVGSFADHPQRTS